MHEIAIKTNRRRA